MNDARRGIAYGIAAFSAWGLLSPGNEILLRQFTPMWMQVARAALATVIVLAFAGRGALGRAVDILRDPKMLQALVWGTFVSFALFAYSQTRVEATFTTLGFYTAPLWTALLGRVVLGERVGWIFGPAIALLLAGGYFALTGGGSLPAPDAWGILLAVGAGASWGVYAVLFRRDAGEYDWKDLLLASMVLGLIGFTTMAALTEPLPRLQTFTGTTWLWTAIQATIPTILALGLFQTSLRLAPAGQVNILVGFELAATVFFAWLLLDASFTGTQLAGLAVALLAVTGYLALRSDDAGDEQSANGE